MATPFPPYPLPALEEGVREASPRRKALIIGGVSAAAVLVAAGIVFAILARDGGSPNAVPPSPTTPTATPAFAFHIQRVVPVPTVATQTMKSVTGPAQQASKQAVATLGSFYSEAFLNPVNWRAGEYDSAWSMFDAPAAQRARADGGTLTAGADAGSAFTDIRPAGGVASTQVLVDPRGNPVWVAARVTFSATGSDANGTTTLLVSAGHYFLRRLDGGWKIVAFDVHRQDHRKNASPASSVSPSSSPSGSPS